MKMIRTWWAAVVSGWKAGRKQYRKRLTELRKPVPRPVPLSETKGTA